MSIFDLLAEERIRAAQARGELSGLPGEGRPLVFEDDCLVPREVRMSNKILRNAGYVPPALADLRALGNLAEVLATTSDADASARLSLRMTRLLLRVEAAGLAHVAAAILRRRDAKAVDSPCPDGGGEQGILAVRHGAAKVVGGGDDMSLT